MNIRSLLFIMYGLGLGSCQVSILSPFWPDVCFEGLEEDIEQSMEGGGGGGSPGDSNNGDEVSVEEDEYMKVIKSQ